MRNLGINLSFGKIKCMRATFSPDPDPVEIPTPMNLGQPLLDNLDNLDRITEILNLLEGESNLL